MAEHFEETIAARVDDLARSVGARFDAVDVRFDAVDARFDAVDARFVEVDARFDAVDARFVEVDARFDTVDARFDEVREHFVEMRDFTTFCFDKLGRELRAEMAQGHGELRAEMSEVKVGLVRVERRLDRHEDLLGQVLTEVRAIRRGA